MSKLSKTFLVLCICGSYGLSAFSQYNQNTNVFKRKKSPTTSSPTNNSSPSNFTRSTPSDDIYKNAGIRTAIYEEVEAQDIIEENPKGNPGHTLNQSSTNTTYTRKSLPDNSSRTTPERRETPNYTPASRNSSTAQAQTPSRNSQNTRFKVKRANIKSSPERGQNGAFQNEKTLNFDVLNEGKKATATNNNRSYTPANQNRNYTPSQRRSTSYYSNHYNNGVKIYNQKGQQVSANYSNTNRTVIIVPAQGLTVTGVVTSDDPGRSITIKDNQGKSISYQYTEMDALVNI